MDGGVTDTMLRVQQNHVAIASFGRGERKLYVYLRREISEGEKCAIIGELGERPIFIVMDIRAL